MSMITRFAVVAVALAAAVGCAATNDPESNEKESAVNDDAPRMSVYAEDPRGKEGEEAKAGQITPSARMVCRTMWCCDAPRGGTKGPGECYRCTVCD